MHDVDQQIRLILTFKRGVRRKRLGRVVQMNENTSVVKMFDAVSAGGSMRRERLSLHLDDPGYTFLFPIGVKQRNKERNDALLLSRL